MWIFYHTNFFLKFYRSRVFYSNFMDHFAPGSISWSTDTFLCWMPGYRQVLRSCRWYEWMISHKMKKSHIRFFFYHGHLMSEGTTSGSTLYESVFVLIIYFTYLKTYIPILLPSRHNYEQRSYPPHTHAQSIFAK